MFSPKGMGLERGWPGRVDGDRVIQLAAQTLQVYFTAGGALREHAEYALADVELRPPVHPPSPPSAPTTATSAGSQRRSVEPSG